MLNRFFALIVAVLILSCFCADQAFALAPVTPELRNAVASGMNRENRWGKVAAFQINIMNISGNYAFVDATPLDKDHKPLAEQQVAVLEHVFKESRDMGWKELDLSKVPMAPNEEELGPLFCKNIRKVYPFLPKQIFKGF